MAFRCFTCRKSDKLTCACCNCGTIQAGSDLYKNGSGCTGSMVVKLPVIVCWKCLAPIPNPYMVVSNRDRRLERYFSGGEA